MRGKLSPKSPLSKNKTLAFWGGEVWKVLGERGVRSAKPLGWRGGGVGGNRAGGSGPVCGAERQKALDLWVKAKRPAVWAVGRFC